MSYKKSRAVRARSHILTRNKVTLKLACNTFHYLIQFHDRLARFISQCLVLFVLAITGVSANAATRTWTGSANGLWSNPNNWSPQTAPVSGDSLVFPMGTATPSVTNDLNGLLLQGIEIGGPGYTLNGNAITLAGSCSCQGTINIPLTLTGVNASIGDLSNSNNTNFTSVMDVKVNGVYISQSILTGGLNTYANQVTLGSVQLSGGISGSGSIIIDSPTMISGAGTFSGEFSGSPLYLNNASLPNATISTTELAGNGTVGLGIDVNVIPSQTYANTPGSIPNSTGIITFSTIQNPNLTVTLNGTSPGTGYSQVGVTASIPLISASSYRPLVVNIAPNFIPTVGQVFVIVNNTANIPVIGTFPNIPEGAKISLASGVEFVISYRGGDGNDITLTTTTVPKTWTGLAGQLWSNASNWLNGIPQSGDTLSFPASATNKQSTNDLSGLSISGLILDSGYNLTGNKLTLQGTYQSNGNNIIGTPVDVRQPNLALNTSGPLDTFIGVVEVNASGMTFNQINFDGGLNINTNDVRWTGNYYYNSTRIKSTLAGSATLTADNLVLNTTGAFSGIINAQYLSLQSVSLPSVTKITTNVGSGNGAIGGILDGGIEPLNDANNGPGMFTAKTIACTNRSLSFRVNGTTPGTGHSQLIATNGITLSGCSLRVYGTLSTSALSAGQSIILVRNDGISAVNGIFSGLLEGTIVQLNGASYALTYKGGDGNDIALAAVGVTPSTTTLSSNSNPSTVGQTVTFRATVAGSSGTPTGSVTFFNAGSVMGTVNLTTGQATYPLTFGSAGTRAITATYSGDVSYAISSGTLAGGQSVVNPTITLSPSLLPSGLVGTTYPSTTFSASGGTPSYTYSIISGALPTGLSLSAAGTLFGIPTVAGSYSFSVQVRDLISNTNAFGYTIAITLPVVQQSQTIMFNNPGTQSVGATINLSAIASSGLPVSYSTITPGICAVNIAGAVNFAAVGICTIASDQAGNLNFFAAPRVLLSFQVIGIVPGTPQALTCSGGVSIITCSFAPPSNTGSSAIQNYRLSCTLTNTTFSAISATSPISIANVQLAGTYNCVVSATNANGTGVSSSPSVATISGAAVDFPSTVWITRAIAGNAGATVAFTGSVTDGGTPILRYTATSTPGNISASCTLPCSSIVVNGLTNGVTYTFTVVAVNSLGSSGITSVSNAVTPLATIANTSYPIPLSLRSGAIDPYGQNRSNIFVITPTNQSYLGVFNGSQFTWTLSKSFDTTQRFLGVGDFDGNGSSDYSYQTASDATYPTGTVQIHPFNLGTASGNRGVKREWLVQTVADLDGDGYSDMVFRWTGFDPLRPQDTGVSYIWFMKGGALNQVRKRGGAPLDWKLLGAADINGDFAADMVYISPTNQVRVLMATPKRTCANIGAGSLPSGFVALGVADYQANGRAAILARNPTTGAVILYTLDARSLTLPAPTADPDDPNAPCTASNQQITTSTITLPGTLGFSYYASGDFNADGYFDIAWVSPSGQILLWLMGTNSASPTGIFNAGTIIPNTTVLQP